MGPVLGDVGLENRSWLQKLEMNLCLKKLIMKKYSFT